MAQPTKEELRQLFPDMFDEQGNYLRRPVAASPIVAPPAARPKAKTAPAPRAPTVPAPRRTPPVAPLPAGSTRGGPTALPPKQFGQVREDRQTAVAGRQEEKEIARQRAELASTTDFETYMRLSEDLAALEARTTPADIVPFATATPQFQGEAGLFGFSTLDVDAAKGPINVPGDAPGFFEFARPRTVVGPLVTEELSGTGALRGRASLGVQLIPDSLIAESVKDSSPEEAAEIRDILEARRTLIRNIAESNPNMKPEAVSSAAAAEFEDILTIEREGKGRLGVTTQEPGKAAGGVANLIFSRKTTPGTVPNVSPAQIAFYEDYYRRTYPKRARTAEGTLRATLTNEDIAEPAADITEAEVASSAGPRMVTRKRTPYEIEEALRARLPAEMLKLKTPVYLTSERGDVLANPEKYSKTGLYGGSTTYATGATREGVGAFTLRTGMAPFNVVATALTSGASRFAERAVPGDYKPELSNVGAARAKRAEAFPRLKELPEGFIGDLGEVAIQGRGASQFTGDLYKELGLNEAVGAALGLGIDLLVPPFGGLVSAPTAGVRGFNAAKAVRAAGLLSDVSPAAAGARAAGGAFRDAWTFRPLGQAAGGALNREVVGTFSPAAGVSVRLGGQTPVTDLLPGSMRLVAAEETGKVLGFRAALREAEEAAGRRLTLSESLNVANAHEAAVGVGKWSKDFDAAARAGRSEAERFVAQLTDDVANIPTKGHYLSGASAVVKDSDRFTDAVRGARGAPGDINVRSPFTETLEGMTEAQLRTILANAAGRNDDVLRALQANPDAPIGQLFREAMGQSHEAAVATRSAAASVAAYDALARASGGFRNLKDMVLISNRFIGTTEGAARALAAAGETALGKQLKALTDEILDGTVKVTYALPKGPGVASRGVRTDVPIQVVAVSPQNVGRTAKDLNYLYNAGHIGADEFTLGSAMLTRTDGPPVIPLSTLRAMAEGNVNAVIATKGLGLNVEAVKFAPRGGVGMDIPLPERMQVAQEVSARKNLFTPTQMRSAFDGLGSVAAAFRQENKALRDLLDVSPLMQRRLDDFAAKVGVIDKDIVALRKELMDPDSQVRAAYGLPTGAKLTDDEVMSAIAKGVNDEQTGKFIDEAINTMLYKVEARASSLGAVWRTVSVYSTNQDKYLTAAGIVARNKLVATAKTELASGDNVLEVTRRLRQELETMMNDKDLASALWRVEKGVVALDKDLAKVIGASMYTREVDNLKTAVINSSLLETPTQNLFWNYPAISDALTAVDKALGDVLEYYRNLAVISPPPNIPNAFVAAAMRARLTGPASGSWEEIIRQYAQAKYGQTLSGNDMLEVLALLPSSAYAGLGNISPILNGAADMTSARAGLNSINIEDYISAYAQAGERARAVQSTSRFVAGGSVQDALEEFVGNRVQNEVFQAVAKELVQSAKPLHQRLLNGLANMLQLIGNIRYNLFLYMRPAYHSVNVLTAPAILHATLGLEGMPGFTSMSKAAGVFESGADASVTVGGRTAGVRDYAATEIAFRDKTGRVFTYGDLRELGLRSGIMKTEQQVLFSEGALREVQAEAARMEGQTGRTIPTKVKAALNDLTALPADFANSTDNLWRMGSFIEALAQGKPLSVAQEIAKKSLFDYGSLLPKERAFASRFLIFYTFGRVSAVQMAGALGSTAGATRFLRQAAVSRDVSAMMYEMAGGEDYDLRRLYMSDRQLAKITMDQQKVGSSEVLQLSPSLPMQDSFMQLMGVLYARNPFQVVVGTETGLAQYLDPGIKFLLELTDERKKLDAKRADKLRIMDARHVAVLFDNGAVEAAAHGFGPLTALTPSRDATMTYLDKEWQMTPDGYARYKAMANAASVLGLRSTAEYYIQYSPAFSEQELQRPGKDKLGGSLGMPYAPTVTPQQQEAAVLRAQAEAVKEREKQRAMEAQ